MKLSVYSLTLKDKTPEEVVEMAREFSCGGIEWWCREEGHLDAGSLEASSKAIAGIMKGSGIVTAGLAPYFSFSETPSEVEAVFAAAKTIGAPIVRCHSYRYPEKNSVYSLIDRQRKWLETSVMPSAERHGIRLVIEQHHNTVCATPEACRRLVDGLPLESAGIIYDPGNSLFEGFTRAENALSVFGDYLAHVHVKNAKPVSSGGSVPEGKKYPMDWGAVSAGDIDWEHVVNALHGSGYRGFISLESLDSRSSEDKMKQDIPYLSGLLERLGREEEK